jgi:hypothetical protein
LSAPSTGGQQHNGRDDAPAVRRVACRAREMAVTDSSVLPATSSKDTAAMAQNFPNVAAETKTNKPKKTKEKKQKKTKQNKKRQARKKERERPLIDFLHLPRSSGKHSSPVGQNDGTEKRRDGLNDEKPLEPNGRVVVRSIRMNRVRYRKSTARVPCGKKQQKDRKKNEEENK